MWQGKDRNDPEMGTSSRGGSKVEILPPEGFGSSFTNQKIRANFIKKVYMIVLSQLAITTTFVAVFSQSEAVKNFSMERLSEGSTMSKGLVMYIAGYVIFFVTYMAIVCCPSVRRKHPLNLVVLGMFTISLSFMVGVISVFHNSNWIWIAMAITAGIVLALTLFAFQTKYDFTGIGFYLWGVLWCVIIFGIMAIYFWQTHRPILHSVYCGLIALVFSMYLVYDTQRLMGGKKYSLSPEEHVYAAVEIYIDVVQIFLAVLGLGGRD